ncbi:hypothetical protein EBT16_03595, partial [bacterium]|nr:hypothetical protein [bacterium]
MAVKYFVLCLGICFSSGLIELSLRLRERELFSFENQILKKVKQRPNPCLSVLDRKLGWKTAPNKTAWVSSIINENIKS